MPAGRPRKPVAQRLLEGSYKPSRHGPLVAQVEASANPPIKPSDLNEDASALWDSLVGMLSEIVCDRDSALLAEACWLWGELQRIKAVVDQMIPGEKGYKQLLSALGICTDKFDKIASRFGLTPSDRAKLGTAPAASAKPKVVAKGPTALDRAGPPKGKAKGKK